MSDETIKDIIDQMQHTKTQMNAELKQLFREKLDAAKQRQVGGDHYKNMGVEPWDVVDSWPIEQQIGYHRGNVLKYVMRMGNKDEQLQEIKKAAHYIQKLVEILEKANER